MYQWYGLVVTNGEKPAPMLRDVLAKQVTSAHIAEAKQLAGEWKLKGK
jgi:hypothetical protein